MKRWIIAGALAATAAGPLAFAPAAAQDGEPIVLGELNSYGAFTTFTEPTRKGWQLALDEINAEGGALGRQIEVVSRDDGASTGDAVRTAEELVTREDAVLLFGTFLSNVGLAVSDFANQREVPFVATAPLTDSLTMENGNRYTYRFRPSTYMQVRMLVEAAAERTDATRWAIVAPNYEYGQASAQNFKDLVARIMPEAEIVAEQYPALGQIDAGATIQAIERANPDGIFNVLFGGDLAQFVREGNIRGTFEDREVVSLLTGEPEWLNPLGAEAPVGWIATGYPWYDIADPDHLAFIRAYQAKFDEDPALGSVLGYSVMRLIHAAIEEAGSTETEAVLAALETLEIEAPFGTLEMRAIDNQGTMGAWVGRLANDGNGGYMTDWDYLPGADYMFAPEEVEARRPAGE
ncbi:MAG: ABC transporter substrate-binding protein [Azospirillaceae bacterium]